MGDIVFYSDRLFRALLCTNAAADTADSADCHNVLTLILRAALYTALSRLRDELDQVFRAGSYALATGLTSFSVYNSDTIYYMNGIKRAGSHTGTIAHTSVGTSFGACTRKCCSHRTILYACIFVFFFCFLTGTCAFNESNLSYAFTCGNAHDRSDLVVYIRAAHRAGTYRSGSGSNCFCQSITACKSTATTVCTGQFLTDRNCTLIYFYFKFYTGDSEEYTDK